MGGCNCKKSKAINNIRDPLYIQPAKEIYKDMIEGRELDTFTELEVQVIYQVYYSLYPASKSNLNLEDTIKQIKEAITLYDVRYKRK